MFIERVTRNRDGKTCAYFIRGGVSPVEFFEQLHTETLARPPSLDQIYCEYWRIAKTRAKGEGSIKKCESDHPDAFAVTGYDVFKWQR